MEHKSFQSLGWLKAPKASAAAEPGPEPSSKNQHSSSKTVQTSSKDRRIAPRPAPILRKRSNSNDLSSGGSSYPNHFPVMPRGFDHPGFYETRCRNPECDLHRRGSGDYIPPSKCLNFPPSTSANHIKWAKQARTARFKIVDDDHDDAERKVDLNLVEKIGVWCKYQCVKRKYKDMRATDRLRPKRNFLKLCGVKEGDCKDEYCLRHDASGDLEDMKPIVVSAKGKERAIYDRDDVYRTVVTTTYLGTSPGRSSQSGKSKPVEKPLLSLREAAERESRAEKLGFWRSKYNAAKDHWSRIGIFEAQKNRRKRGEKKMKAVLNKEIRLTRQAKKMAEIALRRLDGDDDAGKCDEEEWKQIVEATTKAKEAAVQRLEDFDPMYAAGRRKNVAVKAFNGMTLALCRARANIPKIFTNAGHVTAQEFEPYVAYHNNGRTFRPVFHKEEQRARELALWLWRRAERRRGRELWRELVQEEKVERRKVFVRGRWERNRRRRREVCERGEKMEASRGGEVVGSRALNKEEVKVQGETLEEMNETVLVGSRGWTLKQADKRVRRSQVEERDELGDDYFDLSYQDENLSKVQQQRRARVRGPRGSAQRMELLDHLGPEAMAEDVELHDRISESRRRDLEVKQQGVKSKGSFTTQLSGGDDGAPLHRSPGREAIHNRPPTPFQPSTENRTKWQPYSKDTTTTIQQLIPTVAFDSSPSLPTQGGTARLSTQPPRGDELPSQEFPRQAAILERRHTPFQPSTETTVPHQSVQQPSNPQRPLSWQTQPNSFPSQPLTPIFSEPAAAATPPRQSTSDDTAGCCSSSSSPEDNLPLTPEQVAGLERYREEMRVMHRVPREGLVRDSWGRVVMCAREEEGYFVESHGRRGEDPE